MDLDGAADELYLVAPPEFVQRRNELAAAAQRAGDKATAVAIKQLRRPTLGAWLANLLVHERKDEVEELLHLGETLRHAQLNPTGPEMRRLAQQRRQVIAALASEARGLARKAGQPVADDGARDLETTLSAVLADQAAATKFRSGRLTSGLEYSGFGPLEHAPGPVPPGDEHTVAKEPLSRGVAERGRRRREAATKALRDARTAASGATEALKEHEDELARLERERDERRDAVNALEQQLEKARTAASASEAELRRAQKARREAEGRLRKARDRVTQAVEELDRLTDR